MKCTHKSPPVAPAHISAPRKFGAQPGEADIIGDVHGHADQLLHLLDKLGYVKTAGRWQHRDYRMAVFTGDLINKGPAPRKVLQIVSGMLQSGCARCVMGNHEFNALLHYSPGADGRPLRRMSERQSEAHRPTLETLVTRFPVEWEGWLKWMKNLPLWYDGCTFRVVHACWDREARTWLLNPRLTDQMLQSCASDSVEFRSVSTLLCGPVCRIGNAAVRVRWWDLPASPRQIAEVSLDNHPEAVGQSEIPDGQQFCRYDAGAPLLFVGHYGRIAPPGMRFAENIICVDTDVAGGGPLAAWRLRRTRAGPVMAG